MKPPLCFLVVVALAYVATPPGHACAQSCPVTLASLKKLGECELDRVFEQALPGEIPVGRVRGQVLLMTDAKLPRFRACLANSIWKGKQFDECGEFINQWLGFKALRGKAEPGISGYDGKPCLVFAYPPGTPVFANTYDEVREVAPGLYLARLYERCPCPRFRGYLAIQVVCSCP